MALRSPSRTATPTSGPGRAPGSDSRTRHRLRSPRTHARRQHLPSAADALRLRAQTLFAQGPVERGKPVHGPPGADRDVAEAQPSTTTVSGAARRRAPRAVEPRGRAKPAPAAGDAPETDPAGGAWRERVGPALRERLPLWLQSRCGLERRNTVALGVLLMVAVVFAAQHFWTGRTEPVHAPQVVRAATPYGTPGAKRPVEQTASTDPPPTGGTGTGTATVVVDVIGNVRNPGLRRLPAGSRVADALQAAGGVRPGTSTDGLNRARPLTDGEQVVVGAPAPTPGTGPAGPPGQATGGTTAPGAPVSLSTATVDQLDALPGVGPMLAQRIVDYRSRHGGFRSVDELREVNGIGERRFADLRHIVRP